MYQKNTDICLDGPVTCCTFNCVQIPHSSSENGWAACIAKVLGSIYVQAYIVGVRGEVGVVLTRAERGVGRSLIGYVQPPALWLIKSWPDLSGGDQWAVGGHAVRERAGTTPRPSAPRRPITLYSRSSYYLYPPPAHCRHPLLWQTWWWPRLSASAVEGGVICNTSGVYQVWRLRRTSLSARGSWRGVLMSYVYFKKCQCCMFLSLDIFPVPCRI